MREIGQNGCFGHGSREHVLSSQAATTQRDHVLLVVVSNLRCSLVLFIIVFLLCRLSAVFGCGTVVLLCFSSPPSSSRNTAGGRAVVGIAAVCKYRVPFLRREIVAGFSISVSSQVRFQVDAGTPRAEVGFPDVDGFEVVVWTARERAQDSHEIVREVVATVSSEIKTLRMKLGLNGDDESVANSCGRNLPQVNVSEALPVLEPESSGGIHLQSSNVMPSKSDVGICRVEEHGRLP